MIEIFFCYAREDDILRQGLEKQLRALRRQELIDVWHDRDIRAGMEWEREIDKHLNTAKIILLLVSPDFMDSDYCYSIEMQRAMERHERGEAIVIPIILRPVYWKKAPFGKLQGLPTDGMPVMSSSWHNLDEAFFNVAEGIRKAVEEIDTEAQINQYGGRPKSLDSFRAKTQNKLSAHHETKILSSAKRLEIERKLKKIIADKLDVDESKVVPNASFVGDLNVDSLAAVELIMAVEDAFILMISDEDAEKISTVQEALEYIQEHLV